MSDKWDDVDEKVSRLKEAQTAARWPKPLDLSFLATREPKQPSFVIDDWLPCGYATLFAGHGGVGKSGIALYLAVCIALGKSFYGLRTRRRKVLYMSCEDREGLLHWRLRRICDYIGVDMSELADWLILVDLVGRDTALWTPANINNLAPTAAMRELTVMMRDTGAQGVFMDGLSDVYFGNENDRAQVKAFCNTMLSPIDQDDGFLVLIGHVAKLGARSSAGDGYSGSTQWHNAVRARWYLYPETAEGDDGGNKDLTGDLLLELQKSNLGRTDHQMRLYWSNDDSLFVGQQVTPETAMDRQSRDSRERSGILKTIRAVEERGEYVPAAMQGPRTAYHVLRACPDFPKSLVGTRAERGRFWRHIEALRRNGDVTEGVMRRKDRHLVTTLTTQTTDNTEEQDVAF